MKLVNVPGGLDPELLARTKTLGAARPHYICACRLNTDYFVHGVDRYYDYDGNDEDFLRRYQSEVKEGILSTEALQHVLQDVKSQSNARIIKFQNGHQVHSNIAATYQPLHPELRTFKESMLHCSFVDIVRNCKRLLDHSPFGPYSADVLRKAGFEVLRDGSDGVSAAIVTVPHVFNSDFCNKLTAELIHFAESGIAYTRPNTMNRNGGVLLYELGFQSFLDQLVSDYLNFVAKVVVPDDFQGCDIDSHKVFTVAYQDPSLKGLRTTMRSGPIDQHLSLHTDNSEATMNLHLAGTWTGGGLNFYGRGTSGNYENDLKSVKQPERLLKFRQASSKSQSFALFHSGSEFHEAQPIDSGWRLNLIMWLRSSGVRNKQCPMCGAPPSLVQVDSLAGEGFTLTHWNSSEIVRKLPMKTDSAKL